MERKLEDSIKIKSVMLGIMDGKGRRRRPDRKWKHDIKEWCKQDLYSLTISARDRRLYMWHQTMKFRHLRTFSPWVIMMMMMVIMMMTSVHGTDNYSKEYENIFPLNEIPYAYDISSLIRHQTLTTLKCVYGISRLAITSV